MTVLSERRVHSPYSLQGMLCCDMKALLYVCVHGICYILFGTDSYIFHLCVGGAPGSKGKNTVVRHDGSLENVGGKAQVHMATGVSREMVAVT